MKTPKEYLLENYPMFTGFVKHTLVSEMANSYAEYYHESKQSSITAVVQAEPEVCGNCGCGNPKKTYDGYWCKMCHNEM